MRLYGSAHSMKSMLVARRVRYAAFRWHPFLLRDVWQLQISVPPSSSQQSSAGKVQEMRAVGLGVRKTAKTLGVGVGTVLRLSA